MKKNTSKVKQSDIFLKRIKVNDEDIYCDIFADNLNHLYYRIIFPIDKVPKYHKWMSLRGKIEKALQMGISKGRIRIMKSNVYKNLRYDFNVLYVLIDKILKEWRNENKKSIKYKILKQYIIEKIAKLSIKRKYLIIRRMLKHLKYIWLEHINKKELRLINERVNFERDLIDKEVKNILKVVNREKRRLNIKIDEQFQKINRYIPKSSSLERHKIPAPKIKI